MIVHLLRSVSPDGSTLTFFCGPVDKAEDTEEAYTLSRFIKPRSPDMQPCPGCGHSAIMEILKCLGCNESALMDICAMIDVG